MATKEVVDMLPGIQQTSAQAFGTLFLQLTVNDLGICLPITNTPQVIKMSEATWLLVVYWKVKVWSAPLKYKIENITLPVDSSFKNTRSSGALLG